MDSRFNAPPASSFRTLFVLVALLAVFATWMLATAPEVVPCEELGSARHLGKNVTCVSD